MPHRPYRIEHLESRLLLAANAWKTAVAGDWSDATKWSAGHVPTATEDVSIAVAGSYTVTHNSGVTDSIKSLTISASSATLNLAGGKIQVSGATTVSGGTFTLQGGTLLKGSLATSGAGKFQVISSGTLDGVTIASDLGLTSGTLYLEHTVTLNSGKKITASDATVYLYDQPDGGATLAGTGEVVLNGASGGTVNLYNGYGHNASISANVKVHGYGSVYFYGGTNVATIQADQNGKTLSINGGTWINNGTLSATNGGILTISGTAWSSPSPGKLSETSSTLNLAGNFSNIALPTRTAGNINVTGIFDLKTTTLALTATTGAWNLQGGTIKNGTISQTSSLLNFISSGTLDKVTLSNDVTVTSTTLYLEHANTLATGKKINVNDGTLYLYDQPDAGASLGGTGEIVLAGASGGNLTLYNGYGHNAVLNTGIKAHGYGNVYFYGGTNNSTITADQNGKTLSLNGGTWINKGALSAINGGIMTIQGTAWSSPTPGTLSETNSTLNLAGNFSNIVLPTRTGGNINVAGIYDLLNTTLALTATTGSWNVQGGTIKNATINLSGGAALKVVSSATFDHVTFATDFTVSSATLYLEHVNTLSAGKKIIVPDGTLYLYDQPNGGASLTGSGEIVLGGTSGGSLTLYNGYGHNATIASGIVAHGFGNVYFYGGSNNSTLRADVAGKTLNVSGGTWSNLGTLDAINGATLIINGTAWSSPSPGKISETNSTIQLSGNFSNITLPVRTGGTITLNGVYDLKNSTLNLTSTQGAWNFQGGTVKNGSVNLTGTGNLALLGSGTFDKVTIASNYNITNATLYIEHACNLSNNAKLTATGGTVYLYDQPDAGASLGGVGEVILAGASGGTVNLYNGYGHTASIGSGVRIHGLGNIYSYGSTNNGIIEADVAGKTLILNGGAMTNKGIIRASHGGTLQLQTPSILTNQGALAAEGGTILISGAFNTGATGIIDIGIGGTGQGTTYGLINCTGALTLAGTINTYLTGGFKPANNATFTPIKYASKTGAFVTSNFNAGGGVAFTPTFGATSLSIKANTAASSVASVTGGKLTLNGTSAIDTLSVTDALGVVTAVRGGVTSVFSSTGITGINITGGDNNDTITYTGSVIPSTLSGGNGNDKITGSATADVISGDAGNDTEIGGGGNDRYTFAAATAAEADVVSEGSGGGTDTLDFSALPATVAVTIKLNSDTLATMTNRTVKTMTAGQFINFENATGGAGNDNITGNTAINVILAGAGNDTLQLKDGTTGHDTGDGGVGTDVLSDSDASDTTTNIP